ncbi:MAG: BatB protein [Bacteroidota bacterium]
MFTIENPLYFLLLLLIPLFVVVRHYYLNWQRKKQLEFGNPIALQKIVKFSTVNHEQFRFILFLTILFFSILALVNPKFGTEKNSITAQGVEVVFALDVSKSMLCKDVSPNRLERAKQIISQLVDQLDAERMGMVAYAGNAYPVLPMTTDYALAKMYLQTINTDLISSQGTAINTALKTGVDFFDNPNAGKVLILLSDGEDHEEAAEKAAIYAKDKEVKVLTIGIGTPQGGPIYFIDEYGEPQVKKDKEGKEVVTKLQETVLENIAKNASGSYIYANQTDEVVALVKKEIQSMKKATVKSQQVAQQKSQFQWFLGVALVLFLLDVFFIENKLFSFTQRNKREKNE